MITTTEQCSRHQDLDALATAYADRAAGADGATQERLRAEFVVTCLPFAHRLARRYQGRGESFDDLEQVARVGLVKAIERFDQERGSFTAYAILTIFGEIKKHFRDNAWGVHVTRRVQDLGLAARTARETLINTLRREPTSVEIAELLDVPIADLDEALRSGTGYSPASLNAPASGDNDAEIGDLLGGLDSGLESADDRVTVAGLIRRLPEREQRMLAMRFHGNRSQAEIAAELGVSQMHVSRLLSTTLSWLREAMLSDRTPPWHGSDPLPSAPRIAAGLEAGVLTISVRGEIDRDNAQAFRTSLHQAMTDHPHGITVVALARVPFMDAAGAAVLLDAARIASVAGRRLTLANPQPQVRTTLAIITPAGRTIAIQ